MSIKSVLNCIAHPKLLRDFRILYEIADFCHQKVTCNSLLTNAYSHVGPDYILFLFNAGFTTQFPSQFDSCSPTYYVNATYHPDIAMRFRLNSCEPSSLHPVIGQPLINGVKTTERVSMFVEIFSRTISNSPRKNTSLGQSFVFTNTNEIAQALINSNVENDIRDFKSFPDLNWTSLDSYISLSTLIQELIAIHLMIKGVNTSEWSEVVNSAFVRYYFDHCHDSGSAFTYEYYGSGMGMNMITGGYNATIYDPIIKPNVIPIPNPLQSIFNNEDYYEPLCQPGCGTYIVDQIDVQKEISVIVFYIEEPNIPIDIIPEVPRVPCPPGFQYLYGSGLCVPVIDPPLPPPELPPGRSPCPVGTIDIMGHCIPIDPDKPIRTCEEGYYDPVTDDCVVIDCPPGTIKVGDTCVPIEDPCPECPFGTLDPVTCDCNYDTSGCPPGYLRVGSLCLKLPDLDIDICYQCSLSCPDGYIFIPVLNICLKFTESDPPEDVEIPPEPPYYGPSPSRCFINTNNTTRGYYTPYEWYDQHGVKRHVNNIAYAMWYNLCGCIPPWGEWLIDGANVGYPLTSEGGCKVPKNYVTLHSFPFVQVYDSYGAQYQNFCGSAKWARGLYQPQLICTGPAPIQGSGFWEVVVTLSEPVINVIINNLAKTVVRKLKPPDIIPYHFIFPGYPSDVVDVYRENCWALRQNGNVISSWGVLHGPFPMCPTLYDFKKYFHPGTNSVPNML